MEIYSKALYKLIIIHQSLKVPRRTVLSWLKCSRTPLFQALVIRIGLAWVKFFENSTKLTCLESTGYRIKYSTLLWLLQLQIRGGRMV
jgi:hypothetical protein